MLRVCYYCAVLISIALGACALNPATGDLDVVTMSEKKEISIGKQMHEELVKNQALYDDPKLTNYVQKVGEKLAKHSHRSDLKYYFNVIDSPGVNAFAFPGGYIYINRGLLAYLNSEDQLAAVLAHELGHITARHAVKQSTAKTAMSVLSVVALFGTGSSQVAGATQRGGEVLVSGYGREHELEADRLGAQYLSNAGYDSDALLDVIAILKDQERYAKNTAKARGIKKQTYHGLFSTHPRNDKRLQHIIANAKNVDKISHQTVDPVHFRQAVEGLSFGSTAKKMLRKTNRFYHNKLNFTFSYPEKWQVKTTKQLIIVHSPDQQSALSLKVKRAVPNLTARQFLEQRMNIRTLHRSERLQQYALEGHTGIEPAQASRKPRRIGLFYYRNMAFILSGELSQPQLDKQYLDIINSFRPMRRSERQIPKGQQIKFVQADASTNYRQLARVSNIRADAENQLRLLNSHYPKGEPEQGQWIKIVQ